MTFDSGPPCSKSTLHQVLKFEWRFCGGGRGGRIITTPTSVTRTAEGGAICRAIGTAKEEEEEEEVLLLPPPSIMAMDSAPFPLAPFMKVKRGFSPSFPFLFPSISNGGGVNPDRRKNGRKGFYPLLLRFLATRAPETSISSPFPPEK